ncbi:MAG: hypothetical protein Q8P34_04165 [Bacteroidota bacterium]|nr:hypothetical protein [Bacteroidota bacterium]
MKKLTIASLFLLFIFVQLPALEIDSLTNTKKPLLFEKLYLHVDRELYAPGDIIWLKAYQINGVTHELNANFRNIFVQLVAEDGRVVNDLMLFSTKGQANGEFKTDSLKNGSYTIRAFTKYLQNFGEEALFHKKIWIEKASNMVLPEDKLAPENVKIDISFLPEGGNLVLNAVNTVAFKAIDQKGMGISVTGKIWNDLGDTITSFSSGFLGMGKFLMMPVDDRTYYATIYGWPEIRIKLEPALTNGIAINYIENGYLLRFVLSSNMKLNYGKSFYFVASHKGIVLFNTKIKMNDFTQLLDLSKSQFPKGISKITLLDSTLNQFAERLIFVDDGNADLINLKLSKAKFEPREEVNIKAEALMSSDDSIISTLSVALVNKNCFGAGGNSQNIKSYLLLDSDLKGAIESPATYFVDDNFRTSAEKLDLLMLVHGWRSYFWDDIEKTSQPSTDDWNDAGLDISGYVKKLLWKAPRPDAELSMDYVFKYNNIGKAITDQNGRFLFKHSFLYDTLKVMINAKTKEGSSNLEIMLDPLPKKDSVVSPALLVNSCFTMELNPGFNSGNSFRQMKELEFSPEKGTILLEGVDIIKKKPTAFSRSFGAMPWADRTLTLTKDDYRFANVIDYLKDKLASITEYGDDIMMGPKYVDFMIDAMSSITRDVKTIRMRDIETIDINSSSNSKTIVAIYQKDNNYKLVRQYDDYRNGRIILKVRGFNMPAKFYSPNSTPENIETLKPDYRPTLFWNPELKFENGKTNIDFFTSDELADYVVVVEGITKNGKICFGTASFSVDKN